MRKDTYPKFLDSKDFKKAVKEYNKRQSKDAKSAKKMPKSPKSSVSTSETSLVSLEAHMPLEAALLWAAIVGSHPPSVCS